MQLAITKKNCIAVAWCNGKIFFVMIYILEINGLEVKMYRQLRNEKYIFSHCLQKNFLHA